MRSLVVAISAVLAISLLATLCEKGATASAAPTQTHRGHDHGQGQGHGHGQKQAPVECVGSRFATMGVLYDAVFDSLLPMLPADVRARSAAIKARAHQDLKKARISTLVVSNHPFDMGADEKDPIMKYRDPVSQWIVTQLVNVREGRDAQAIQVENLTLAQAVETVWLYLYVTVMVPLTILRRSIPSIAPLVGPLSVGTLITLPIMLGVYGATALYKALSSKLVDACIVSVTESQKRDAGKTVKDLRFRNAVPAMVRELAQQVSVADTNTCAPVGDIPLTRIVARTGTYLQAVTPDAARDRQIAAMTARVQQFLRTTRVHPNLIPADPADFSSAESSLSQIGLMIPLVGGAPLDIGIGLSKNIRDGAKPGQTVPLSKLSVTKTLTAAYYAYALAAHFVELGWSQAGGTTANILGGLLPIPGISSSLIPPSTGIVGAPNLYGLVVFHNVLRSVCLSEDRKPAPTAKAGQQGATTPAARTRW